MKPKTIWEQYAEESPLMRAIAEYDRATPGRVDTVEDRRDLDRLERYISEVSDEGLREVLLMMLAEVRKLRDAKS